MPNSFSFRSAAAGVMNVVGAVAAVLVLAACGKDVHRVDANLDNASIVRRDSTLTLGPGDVRIASSDSAIEFAIIGDSLYAGLGDATRAKIQRETDSSKVTGTGIPASFEKWVKSTVANALDHQLAVPLSEISRIEYDKGTITIYGTDGKRALQSSASSDKSQFTPQDADALIAVFKTRTSKV